MESTRGIWGYIASDQEPFRRIAIVGAPGSGKTTLLQRLALVFAQNTQRSFNKRMPAMVPVFIFLRDHTKRIISENAPSIAQLLTEHETRERLRPPAFWFERKLEAGKCLVLLDGLDEVANAEDRRKVAAWVDAEMERYPKNRFVITSRPHGYKSNPLKATVLEVQAFTSEQVRGFVRSWYLANEQLSSGIDDEGVRQTAKANSEDLLRRLRSAPTLSALAVNPLLLTMIAMVHRYRGALPGRRVELFAEICDVLLEHWDRAKGIASTLTAAQKRSVLQPLAYHLMQQRRRDITVEDAVKIIREPLDRVGATATDDAAEFLSDVQKGSGLLLEREAGVYSFAHLAFQEYLAAAHLLETGNKAALLPQIRDSWWHETIRLYAAQGDATTIIQTCVDVAKSSNGAAASPFGVLTLAYECLSEARTVEPSMREGLQRELISGFESEDQDRARIASAVVLSLRLRHLVRLNDNVEIDPALISCAEYQLFLDEMRAANRNHQPEHWQTGHFPNGEAMHPVTGVRYQDALRFCGWLTQWARDRGEPPARFRLPTPPEAWLNPVDMTVSEEHLKPLCDERIGTWSDVPSQVIGTTAHYMRRFDFVEMIDRDLQVTGAQNRTIVKALLQSFAHGYRTHPKQFSRIKTILDLDRDFSMERYVENLRSIANVTQTNVIARVLEFFRESTLFVTYRRRLRVLTRYLARDWARNIVRHLEHVEANEPDDDAKAQLDKTLHRALVLVNALAATRATTSTKRNIAAALQSAGFGAMRRYKIYKDFAGSLPKALALVADRERWVSSSRDNMRLRDRARARIIILICLFVFDLAEEQATPYRQKIAGRIAGCVDAFVALVELEHRINRKQKPWEGIRLVRERAELTTELGTGMAPSDELPTGSINGS